MLDRHIHPRVKPALNRLAAWLDKPGITPDGLTVAGFTVGVLALPFLALGWYLAALVAIVFNRLLDGLDGALARRRGLTDSGGFLDIALDFLFYALVPFGFALAAPVENVLAAAWLLFAFIGTGSSFLAFAALAAKGKGVLKLGGKQVRVLPKSFNPIVLYVVNNLPYCKDEQGEELPREYVVARALDEITSMKVLSRIEGDDTKVSDNLLDALSTAIAQGLKTVTGEENTVKSISLAKLKEMKAKLVSGYTSFWS